MKKIVTLFSALICMAITAFTIAEFPQTDISNGVIKAKLYEDTYTKRPPAKLVLETLDKIANAK